MVSTAELSLSSREPPQALPAPLPGAAPLAAAAPVPWHWFEFRRRAVLVNPAAGRGPGHDPDSVLAVAMDGHTIPFKYLRRPAINGSARPVLMLLHGMGLTIATYRNLAPFLLATHDLVLPDYSGLSLAESALPDHTSFKGFAAAVWRIADALGVERLSLAGNSLGGGLSLMATMMAPERVARLVLSNPACFPQVLPRTYRHARIPLWGELMLGLTSPERLVAGVEYIGYVDKTRFHPVLRGIYVANLRRARNRLRLMQLIRQLPANGRDTAGASHIAQLQSIRQPVLISYGLQDPLLVEGAGARLAELLANATYEPLGEFAHMPHEEAPELIGPRWARFLNG